MSDLDQKTNAVFAGKVVRKDLVRKVKVGANVPVYVLEYLLGKYCATDDPHAIDAGLRLVNTTLANNFVRPDEANKAQSYVKEKGYYTLIDKVKVGYLSDDDKYWAEIVNFGHRYVHVPDHYVRQYDLLLMGGFGRRSISGTSMTTRPAANAAPFGLMISSRFSWGRSISTTTVRAGGSLMPTSGSICWSGASAWNPHTSTVG
jgi:predicted ATP-dependent Lon-type protease